MSGIINDVKKKDDDFEFINSIADGIHSDEKVNVGNLFSDEKKSDVIDIENEGDIDTDSLSDSELQPYSNNTIIAEYLWIGVTGFDIRGKAKMMKTYPQSVKEIPIWNYAGDGEYMDKEVLLQPVAFCLNPFRGENHVLVWNDSLDPGNKKGIRDNFRGKALESLCSEKCEKLNFQFEMQQEYRLLEKDGMVPIGWQTIKRNFDEKVQDNSYSVGIKQSRGRDLAEAHYKCCLYAGLKIKGFHSGKNIGEWCFEMGGCRGIEMGDQLWLARYMLERVSEDFNMVVSMKRMNCFTKVSTKPMRSKAKGFAFVQQAVSKLESTHKDFMEQITAKRQLNDNRKIPRFTSAVGKLDVSVKIPRQTQNENRGFIQDRRIPSDCDPYQIIYLYTQVF